MSLGEEYLRTAVSDGVSTNCEDRASPVNDPYIQQTEDGGYKCTLCSSALPSEYHVSNHVDGKLHKKKLSYSVAYPTETAYFDQYKRQFFENDDELSFGMISSTQAPAHFAEEMRCELCDSVLYSFEAWVGHFIGKKHIKARRNNPNRLFWQCLFADFPYYYEHISGMWQTDQPKNGVRLKDGLIYVVPPIDP